MQYFLVRMPKTKFSYVLFVSVVLSLLPTEFRAQTVTKYQLDFVNDNDLYTNILQDRYYSNGLFINFRWMQKTDFLPSYPKKIWSVGIGHQIFLPYKSQIDSLANVDRPFAAYLHANGSLQLFKSDETFHRVTVQLGIMGPSARGKEIQLMYHESIGIFRPRGWQYQLKNEFGFNLVYDYLRLLHHSKNRMVDVGLPAQVRLGNTFSGISAGVLFRVGRLNSYSSSTYTGGILACDECGKNRYEYYFYIEPQLDYVAYNATIQGRMFGSRDPNAMAKKNFVYETILGAAFSAKHWGVKFAAHFRTKDTDSQRYPHSYGSIGIELRL